jgi:hypothetical protein
MRPLWIRGLALGLGVSVGGPGVLPAQSGVELAPVVGVYAALMNTIEVADGTTAKQATAWAAGGRVSLNTHRKVGFEGTFMYSPSDVEVSAGASGGAASLGLVNVRAVFFLAPPEARVRFYLAGGGAVIFRSGEFYSAFSGGTTDVGGNVAAGLRFHIGRVIGRVEVESYLYSVNLKSAGGFETGSQFQADLIGSVSVAIPLGG